MSSKRYAPLNIDPAPSRGLAVLLLLGTLAAIVAVFLSALPGWGRGGALLLVTLALWHGWRTHVSVRAPHGIRRLGRDAQGRWWIETGAGGVQRAQLLAGSTVFPGLTVLQFRTSSGRLRAIALTSGRLSAGSWRRLLVALRHENPLGE